MGFLGFLGLIPGRVWLGIAVAVMLMAAVGWVWNEGDNHGAGRVQQKWDAEKAATAKEIARLNAEARNKEQRQAAELAVIGANHDQALEDLEAQRRRDVDAARSGALKLRIPGACPASRPETAAPAPGGNDATAGELPPEITGRLLDLANDADRNTKQLAACQAVVTSYLKGNP